jgi:hypothetical protein
MRSVVPTGRQVAGFISRFTPEVARAARSARATVRRLLPGAVELVDDNYNALALAYSTSERASDVILSIALYPRWVSLFLARGALLPDPKGILRGSGKRIRHVVLQPVTVLDSAPVRKLIKVAVETHPTPLARGRGRTIVKSVSAKQRPRRPPARGLAVLPLVALVGGLACGCSSSSSPTPSGDEVCSGYAD